MFDVIRHLARERILVNTRNMIAAIAFTDDDSIVNRGVYAGLFVLCVWVFKYRRRHLSMVRNINFPRTMTEFH